MTDEELEIAEKKLAEGKKELERQLTDSFRKSKEKEEGLTYYLWNSLLTFNGILISAFSILSSFNKDYNYLILGLISLSMLSSFAIVYGFLITKYIGNLHFTERKKSLIYHLESSKIDTEISTVTKKAKENNGLIDVNKLRELYIRRNK